MGPRLAFQESRLKDWIRHVEALKLRGEKFETVQSV